MYDDMSDSQSPASNLMVAIKAQLERWAAERAQLIAQVAEIDAKLEGMADLMGLDASTMAALVSNRPEKPVDKRRAGTMVEYAMALLATAPGGTTRGELKAKIKEHTEFGPKLTRNENAFYNIIARGLGRGEIIERGGRLYDVEHAPSAGDEPASQSATLFDRADRNA